MLQFSQLRRCIKGERGDDGDVKVDGTLAISRTADKREAVVGTPTDVVASRRLVNRRLVCDRRSLYSFQRADHRIFDMIVTGGNVGVSNLERVYADLLNLRQSGYMDERLHDRED